MFEVIIGGGSSYNQPAPMVGTVILPTQPSVHGASVSIRLLEQYPNPDALSHYLQQFYETEDTGLATSKPTKIIIVTESDFSATTIPISKPEFCQEPITISFLAGRTAKGPAPITSQMVIFSNLQKALTTPQGLLLFLVGSKRFMAALMSEFLVGQIKDTSFGAELLETSKRLSESNQVQGLLLRQGSAAMEVHVEQFRPNG